jgi:hypothetical protein
MTAVDVTIRRAIVMPKIKTEHAGAKNGGGYWGKREEAKRVTRRLRRASGKQEEQKATTAPRSPSQYHVVFTPEDDCSAWNVHLVEKPNGCLVLTWGRSLAQTRRRIREALACALDDESAAHAAELIEQVKLPEIKKCAAIRKRREQVERSILEVERDASELARALRAKGFRPADIRELLGAARVVRERLTHAKRLGRATR